MLIQLRVSKSELTKIAAAIHRPTATNWNAPAQINLCDVCRMRRFRRDGAASTAPAPHKTPAPRALSYIKLNNTTPQPQSPSSRLLRSPPSLNVEKKTATASGAHPSENFLFFASFFVNPEVDVNDESIGQLLVTMKRRMTKTALAIVVPLCPVIGLAAFLMLPVVIACYYRRID